MKGSQRGRPGCGTNRPRRRYRSRSFTMPRRAGCRSRGYEGAQERHAEKEKAGDRIIDTSNFSLSKLDRFITLHGFGDGFLDWQSFHAGGAIEAVDAFGVMQNIFGVLRFRNRATVA
jgi:hypothetical protein